MDFYKKLSWIVISICLIIVGFASYEASKIKVDYEYEKYFPENSESLKYFKNYTKEFGSDNDFLFLAIKNNSGVFNAEFLQKIKELGDSISADSSVEFIISPVHNLSYFKEAGFNGIIQKPYIQTDWESLKQDSILVANAPKLMGNIFSKTTSAISIFVKTKDRLPKAPAIALSDKLYRLLDKGDFDEYHISGRIIAQIYYVDKMIIELAIFMSSSILLVIIFLWIAFRNFWGIIIPLFTVIFSIITTVAIMQITGKSFDLLMVMLPTIIFVVGMSDLVHFLSKYYDEIRFGLNKKDAIVKAYKEVGVATFLTSLTTAIGFFSLLTADIIPIREFGIYSGIAVFVAYFFAFTMLPAIFMLLPVPKNILENKNKFQWLNGLNRSFMGIIKYRKLIVGSSLILISLSFIGISQLKVNNYLLEDLNENDPLRKDFDFLENHFSGVRPFELNIEALNGTNILDYKNVLSIDKLEKYLESKYAEKGIGFSISPLDPIKMVYYIKHKNNIEYYKIPDSEKKYSNIIYQMKMLGKNIPTDKNSLTSVLSNDSLSGRITGKINDIGGYKMKIENQNLTQFITDSIDNPNLNFKITGTALLIDKNNETLVNQLLLGLLLALIIVGIIMGIIFKSFKLVIISLIPNVIPLVMIAGIMYLGGFDIKISTSLIFTLAFGIAVDDTIHFLSKLKLELNKGHSMLFALRRSYVSTGKAIIVTTLILCGGFVTLMMSDFTSTFTMGLLISITLLIAVVVDLTILPLLLIKWMVKKKKKI